MARAATVVASQLSSGNAPSTVGIFMTVYLPLTLERDEIIKIRDALNLTFKPEMLTSVVRVCIQRCLDAHFDTSSSLASTIYDLQVLKPYWFRSDEFGNKTGGWHLFLPNEQLVYVSHSEFCKRAAAPLFSKRATCAELSIGGNNMRLCCAMIEENVREVLAKFEKKLEAANADRGQSLIASPDVTALQDKINLLADMPALIKGLEARVNSAAIKAKKNNVVLLNAPYINTAEDDAAAILDQIGNLASFGEFKALRRGRKDPNSRS